MAGHIGCISALAAESNDENAVCVVGHWVAMDILNDLIHTSQVGVCVCMSYKCNEFVPVVSVFPYGNQVY